MSIFEFGNGGLYIATHRVGNISCANIFESIDESIENRGIHRFRDISQLKRANYKFIFSLIRNPYSRIISSWRLLGQQFQYKIGFNEHISFLSELNLKDYELSYEPNQSLKSMIMAHSVPLTSYFSIDGKIPDNIFLLKLENINTGWKDIKNKISELLNLQFPDFPHKNKSPINNNNKNPDISNESKELISLIYEDDFKNFNYDPPI